jgi:hypothetical protein
LYALLLLSTLYTFVIFGNWFYERYLFPWTLLLTLILAFVLDELFVHLSLTKRSVVCAAVFVLMGIFLCNRESMQQIARGIDTNEKGYMDAGLWVDSHFKEGTNVGAQQSGAISYFARRVNVVNLDGVVNKDCYEWTKANRGIEYIHHAGIEYIVGWHINVVFNIINSRPELRNDIVCTDSITTFHSHNMTWNIYEVRN